MSLNKLTIDRSVSPEGATTLVCRGRITMETGSQFRSEVKSLAPQNKFLLADMSGVDFVDSSGLGIILGTYISARSNGCDLVLLDVHPRVKDLLNISHLNKALEGKK
jgi:anti-sigma B factor antagonist